MDAAAGAAAMVTSPVPGDDLRLEKIRAALRAYRAFTRGRSRGSLTWLELSGDIEAFRGRRWARRCCASSSRV